MPITTTRDDLVATVTIDRPERRNALNQQLLDDLDLAVNRAVSGGARAVVLTGAGGHFCAGADLSELEDVAFTRHLGAVLMRLTEHPVLTVAAISGSCMGLGMQLALACDVRLGLMVDHWTIDRLTRYWGEGAARLMTLTAAVLDASDAWRLGFAQRRGDLTLAQQLAAAAVPLAPLTQAGSKQGFEVHDGPTLASYQGAFAAAWASADLREGRAAFLERRPPRFSGV